MAKHTGRGVISESQLLRFLTAPLRWLKVLVVVTAILFGSSIILQTYFHKPDLLQQEIEVTMQLGQQSLWQKWKGKAVSTEVAETGLNLAFTRYAYAALSKVLYDWIPINYLLETTPGDAGYEIKERFLEPNRHYLERFDQTIRVIALRLGNIAFLSIFGLYLSVLSGIDGLVQRCIRQQNASRESAGIYHRAKYWRTGIVSTYILLYLSIPWPVSPLWLIIPISSSALMTFLQAKFLKKYL